MNNFNIVTECGNGNRVIFRYNDMCYIGCSTYTYDSAKETISNKYSGDRDAYIAKLDLLYDTDITRDGVDIIADDNYAVRWASEYGHLDVVKYLVEHGADITADNNYAVRWASLNGHLEVVKYLVEHGADITWS